MCAGPLRDKELRFFPNPRGTAMEPTGWKLYLPPLQGESGSELVRKVHGAPAWARRVARRPGKGHSTQAGSAERSVGDREGRAPVPPSFLSTPFSRAWLFRGSSAFPSHQRPPSPFFPAPAHLRPLQRARPRPRPPLVGPPRPGPLPLVAAAPFTIALPASPPLGSRFAPARCPLGACALRSAAAAAAAPFFFKGKR